MHLFRPYKVQYLNLKGKIDTLDLELSSYLETLSTRSVNFPYSKLHYLHEEINAVRNNTAKVSLLQSLNEKIVGRLYHYNPKLFSMYESIQEKITELTENEKTIFECY